MSELTADDTWSKQSDVTAAPTRVEKAADNASGHVGGPLIAVGVDGSAQSWDAFAWAVGEALQRNGRIVAVFVTWLLEPGEALGGAPLGYTAA
jgi:hypothetical protein